MEKLSLSLGLPQIPDTLDLKQYNELLPIYNAFRALVRALDSYTGILPKDSSDWPQLNPADTLLTQNHHRLYCIFDDTVSAGHMINLYNVAGVIHARKAHAVDATKPCRGFSSGAVTAGNYGEVILQGLCVTIAGLTPGTLYYLSSVTPGAVNSVAPAVAGNLVQPIGFALTATNLFVNPVLNPTIV